VELIDAKLSSVRFANADEVHALIGPRLELCRAIIDRTDRALIKGGRDPISSDGFRQAIIINGARVEDLVFENPLRGFQAEDRLPFSSLTKQLEARRRKASALRLRFSQSLASLRDNG